MKILISDNKKKAFKELDVIQIFNQNVPRRIQL